MAEQVSYIAEYWVASPSAISAAQSDLSPVTAICVLHLQTDHERGIVISAGGKYYLPQAIVLLRILRHNLKSTLPVELFWYGDEEMDDTSLSVSSRDV